MAQRVRSLRQAVTVVLLACALAACVEAAPRVSDDLVQVALRSDPGASSQGLAHGRELYLQRCDTCHELPAVGSQTRAAWPHLVDTMCQRSHLTAAEHVALLRYVLAARDLTR